MDAPPVLTAERIDAMLSIMAEVCLEGVVEAGRFQKAAAQSETPDAEVFERSGRALQRACRNLRQTIAMKQRHDREQAVLAEGAHKVAQAQRAEAERIYHHRVARRRDALDRHFERVLWNELERPDAEDLFDEVMLRVKDAANEDDFLDVPLEDLVARFADEIGIVAPREAPTPPPAAKPAQGRPGEDGSAAKPHSTAEDAEICAESAETPHLRDHCEPSATSAVNDGACGAHQGQPVEAPRPRPRAIAQPPPPEPYIPPWERLRPGQRMPGGTGW